MTTVTLVEKARQGRLAALASLETRHTRDNNIVSIFDFAFEDHANSRTAATSKVIAFRSHRAIDAAEAAELELAA